MANYGNILTKALERCSTGSRDSGGVEEIVAGLKRRNRHMHSSLRQAVAGELADILTQSFGSKIKAIHLYGSTIEFNADLYSDVDIVIIASEASEEIRSFIKEADEHIREEYFLMLSLPGNSSSYLIDAHIIDESKKTPDPSRAYLLSILEQDSVPLLSRT